MRDYSKVSPAFWAGETGRQLRGQANPQRVGFYLFTCPASNMIGLYYLPLPTLLHEVGITKQGASKALRRLSEVGFAFYDTASEYVWVPEMACFQIGETLTMKDNRQKGVLRELENHRKCPFFNAFLDRYGEAYNLDVERVSEAPSKPLRSQEQEQEKEQEQDEESARSDSGESPSPVILLPIVGNGRGETPITEEQVREWEAAYPAVDVVQQLREMHSWLSSNPRKRKTRRGIPRFVNGWLAKEQDKATADHIGADSATWHFDEFGWARDNCHIDPGTKDRWSCYSQDCTLPQESPKPKQPVEVSS